MVMLRDDFLNFASIVVAIGAVSAGAGAAPVDYGTFSVSSGAVSVFFSFCYSFNFLIYFFRQAFFIFCKVYQTNMNTPINMIAQIIAHCDQPAL